MAGIKASELDGVRNLPGNEMLKPERAHVIINGDPNNTVAAFRDAVASKRPARPEERVGVLEPGFLDTSAM